ncbi:MAG TPA: hypothetical protein VL282_09915 [Tepidisphaeraceae bacterium]|jgi:hypothetical protein|nr:hypothetical protein [Tepidisphaeraceae bacterium]
MVNRFLIAFACCALMGAQARGQYLAGPVYPANNKYQSNYVPSGYDPFVLDWSTGRWNYAPIPYSVFNGPFAFNWHTGQWDYLRQPMTPSVELHPRTPAAVAAAQGGTQNIARGPMQPMPLQQGPPGEPIRASSTIEPSNAAPSPQPMQTRTSILSLSHRPFSYTTSDKGFDDWYNSPSK